MDRDEVPSRHNEPFVLRTRAHATIARVLKVNRSRSGGLLGLPENEEDRRIARMRTPRHFRFLKNMYAATDVSLFYRKY